ARDVEDAERVGAPGDEIADEDEPIARAERDAVEELFELPPAAVYVPHDDGAAHRLRSNANAFFAAGEWRSRVFAVEKMALRSHRAATEPRFAGDPGAAGPARGPRRERPGRRNESRAWPRPPCVAPEAS